MFKKKLDKIILGVSVLALGLSPVCKNYAATTTYVSTLSLSAGNAFSGSTRNYTFAKKSTTMGIYFTGKGSIWNNFVYIFNLLLYEKTYEEK